MSVSASHQESQILSLPLVPVLLQRPGDAELLQVLRPGDMAVHAILAAAARGPGTRPHLFHLLFFTCIQPLLILRLSSFRLQWNRRERRGTQVSVGFKEGVPLQPLAKGCSDGTTPTFAVLFLKLLSKHQRWCQSLMSHVKSWLVAP